MKAKAPIGCIGFGAEKGRCRAVGFAVIYWAFSLMTIHAVAHGPKGGKRVVLGRRLETATTPIPAGNGIPQDVATSGVTMDQRYVNTIRACKVILHNIDHLDDSTTFGQRSELGRQFIKVMKQMNQFLEADAQDGGLWVGEE
ncbi:MAG: hypothetical protein O6934_00480 [SAR324 cluster bacterium]|nr:hypothetical protein [SAR324 cluster bacterium]